ncbi:MAG: hypothetical protein JSW58_02835 [Candidatus Latescibacterota bacterium]|nr:MAG: hypothetical protein JSW58_02835 [Candidatus Latescibacterota bacterium]
MLSLRQLPGGRGICLLAIGLLSLLGGTSASANGPYEDAARISAFTRAQQRPAVLSSITRTDGEDLDASFFWLAAQFSLKSKFLVQTEIPYISLATDDDIEGGFGDIRVRAKARVWSGGGGALFVVGSVRFGSGSNALFPYSTQSTDYEAGIGFVDTVGTRDVEGRPRPFSSFSFWLRSTGVYVTRLADRLKKADLHETHLTLAGGVIFPVFRRIELEIGGLGFRFRSGVVREIYFSQLSWGYSPSTELFATLQAERAAKQERASNVGVVAGLQVTF